jgi:hypothetical protein
MNLRSQVYWVPAIIIASAAGVALVIPSRQDQVFGRNPSNSTPMTQTSTSRKANGYAPVSDGQSDEPIYDSSGLHQHLLAASNPERNHLFSMILGDAGVDCLSITGSQYVAADITTWQVHCAHNHLFSVVLSEYGATQVFPIPTGDFNGLTLETVEPIEP